VITPAGWGKVRQQRPFAFELRSCEYAAEPTNRRIGLQKPLSPAQFNGEESWTLPVPARYVIGDSAQQLRNPEAESGAHNRLHHIEGQRGNVEIRKQKRSEREKEAANQPSTEHFQDDWIFHHDGVPLG
jgi:hypothetical protein